MRPELIIFDCDGVLVDSEPVTDAAIAANLARHGLHLPPADSHTLFTGGTMASARDEAIRRGAVLPGNWLDEIYSEIFAALAKGVPLLPGVLPLLEALDTAGIAMAIASNGPRRKMEITLKPSGLWHRFAPHIHSAHDYGRPKPDPHMLLKIISEFGTDPSRTRFIDDSPTGAAAGPAAGIRTFGLGARRFGAGVHPVKDLASVQALLAEEGLPGS